MSKLWMHGIYSTASRRSPTGVTTGILLAALILGAALMMRVPSSFEILGYPGIAMICFLVAIGGSGWFILGISWKDYQDKRKRNKSS